MRQVRSVNVLLALLPLTAYLCGCTADPPRPSLAPATTSIALEEVPADVRAYAAARVDGVAEDSAPGWRGARFDGRARVIERLGMDGPAYYELKVVDAAGQPAGYVVAASGDHDFPIVQYNTFGPAPVEEALGRAESGGARVLRVVRHGIAYILEDQDGALVGSTSPDFTGEVWQSVKAHLGAKPLAPSNEERAKYATAWQRGDGASLGSSSCPVNQPGCGVGNHPPPVYRTLACATTGPVPQYDQLPPHSQDWRNPRDFYTGCGPTAWAMLLGWADNRAADGNDPRWAPYTGLYRRYGAPSQLDTRAPMNWGNVNPWIVSGPMALAIHLGDNLGTYGNNSEGDTTYSGMQSIGNYFSNVGLYNDITYEAYSFGGFPDSSVNSTAVSYLCNQQTPAIIGIGVRDITGSGTDIFGIPDDRHYVVASSYVAWSDGSQFFYTNTGWGGRQNGWYVLHPLWTGTLLPTPTGATYRPLFPEGINVRKATWGLNCPGLLLGAGNATYDVSDDCNGDSACAYTINGNQSIAGLALGGLNPSTEQSFPGALGDPARGCAKDYDIQWDCYSSGSYSTMTGHVDGEADGKRVSLRCPAFINDGLPFDAGDTRRDYSRFSDWAVGRFKAECGAHSMLTGLSMSTSRIAHSALCTVPNTQYETGACHAIPLSSSPSWDSLGYLGGTCAANEYVAGISQATTGGLASLLCCPSTVNRGACVTNVVDGQNMREPASIPVDWAQGYWKAECGDGRAVGGVSMSGPGNPHAILCCEPVIQ